MVSVRVSRATPRSESGLYYARARAGAQVTFSLELGAEPAVSLGSVYCTGVRSGNFISSLHRPVRTELFDGDWILADLRRTRSRETHDSAPPLFRVYGRQISEPDPGILEHLHIRVRSIDCDRSMNADVDPSDVSMIVSASLSLADAEVISLAVSSIEASVHLLPQHQF